MSGWSRRLIPAFSLVGVAALAANAATQPGTAKNPATAKPVTAQPAAAQPGSKSAPAAGAAVPTTDAEREQFFAKEVKPVLQENCISCHSGDKPQGGLKLSSRDAILKGGDSGPGVNLQKPDASLILEAVNYHGRQMPPQGKLSKPKIDALTRWVQMGMPWPAGAQASLESGTHTGPPPVNDETKKFWSFQPVRRPVPPAVKNKAWVKNPIDQFILAKLEKEGLRPNPPADRAALLRRAYYDMIGLPPTPEQVRAFLADQSPNAWEKVVDGLLASPQYGERWGRHWLDLVHFAETNSYERDGPKPNAWRYRDYVINSLNADKPYNQFIMEQLAGDELPEPTPERIIATGYYRLGIWDDEPVDPEQALADDLDDITTTTGEVFLGLTVGCARCHDHKLDPIPTKDYYRLTAFFSGLNRFGDRSAQSIYAASQRPIGTPEEIRTHRQEVMGYRANVRANQKAIDAFEEKVRPDLTPVEKQDFVNDERRVEIVKSRVPKLLSEDDYKQYHALIAERNKLKASQPPGGETALCVTEIGRTPRQMFVMMRGSAHAKGDPVEPGFLSVLSPPEPQIVPPANGETSGRRLALAKWVASPENPLTARVMANRVWQFHFGRGIVRSTSNFGFQGDKPTHPELLDWLSSELVRNGWKLKPLHKQILMSATYQMSSRANPLALKKDPENDFFWRVNMRRLEGEEIRDSILEANGSLNPKMGGPSIYTTIPAEVLAGQSMPGSGWGKSTPEEERRRSVYIYVKRSLITPLLANFDGPETDFSCPARFATTQPTQALGMLNSAFINEQGKVFAQFLKKSASDPEAQVTTALWRTLQRQPTPKEVQRGVRMIQSLQREDGMSADQALQTFCVVALNLNEFMYLD